MSIHITKTTDMYFAAYLRALNKPLADLEVEPGGRCWFVFAMPEADYDQLAKSFWNGTAEVDALAYATAVKMCKAMVSERHRR